VRERERERERTRGEENLLSLGESFPVSRFYRGARMINRRIVTTIIRR